MNLEDNPRFEFRDGSFVEVSVSRVPESEIHETGIKYSFQFVEADGTPILRYDNAHGVHERHEGDGDGIPIEYEGNVEAHLERFFEEVEAFRRP